MITRRDYFAGVALQGLLLSNDEGLTGCELTDSAVFWADSLINSLNELESKQEKKENKS